MIGALSTAISGLFSSTQKINNAAENIADIGDSSGGGASLPQDLIDIKIGKAEYLANLTVIKTTHEMTEELLKTFDEKV